MLLVFAVIPFGGTLDPGRARSRRSPRWFGDRTYPMQIARLDAGLLVVFAFGGLTIIGAMLAGWSSANKFSLLGALRAGSQMISYELVMGLTVLGLILHLRHDRPRRDRAPRSRASLLGLLPAWGIVYQPFARAAVPDRGDRREQAHPVRPARGRVRAHRRLLHRVHAMKMGLFMFAEFIEIAIIGALFTTLFLGGYNLPYMSDAGFALPGRQRRSPMRHGAVVVTQLVVFLVKVMLVCSFQILIRWSLPRFRYDQLLAFAWKFMLPLALANLVVTAVVAVVAPAPRRAS